MLLIELLLDRNQLKEQILMTSKESSTSTTLLLETVVILIDLKLPWACNIVGYLLQSNTFTLFREIALTWKVWFLHQYFFSLWFSFSSSLMLKASSLCEHLFYCSFHLFPQIYRRKKVVVGNLVEWQKKGSG